MLLNGSRSAPHTLPRREMAARTIRLSAYGLMTMSLAAAVFLRGGVYPQQWEWSALGISLASTLAVLCLPKPERAPGDAWGFTLMALLLGWMLFQLLPLPPGMVQRLSPARWSVVSAARAATGYDMHNWTALSVAPSATFGRLLDVIPAMAAFVAAREMAWWWRDRMWVAVAPVIGVACFASILGLIQFYFNRIANGQGGLVSGTYVSHNHFAGLVEMGFPVALMWAIATWRRGESALNRSVPSALWTATLLAIAACLLMGVIVSLSRMGFISTLVEAALVLLTLLGSWFARNPAGHGLFHWGRWIIPVAVPLCVLVVLPPHELIQRFADMAGNGDVTTRGRMEIWRETIQLASAYKWTGCGLGAYERGLYRYKNLAPTNTIDFAHNDYLQIVAELGIAGALLAGALGAWVLSRLLSVVIWRRRARSWELAVGVLGAVLALGVHSLADFNLYIPANALVFAWLCGVGTSTGLTSG
jgi:O-antigen ligase